MKNRSVLKRLISMMLMCAIPEKMYAKRLCQIDS